MQLLSGRHPERPRKLHNHLNTLKKTKLAQALLDGLINLMLFCSLVIGSTFQDWNSLSDEKDRSHH
jgi:hypothetical protein